MIVVYKYHSIWSMKITADANCHNYHTSVYGKDDISVCAGLMLHIPQMPKCESYTHEKRTTCQQVVLATSLSTSL